MSLPLRYRRIISLLETTKRSMTRAEIQQQLGMPSSQVVIRDLATLTKLKALRRSFTGKGNEYAYTFHKWIQKENDEFVGIEALSEKQASKLFRTVTAEGFPDKVQNQVAKVQVILTLVLDIHKKLQFGEQVHEDELEDLRMKLRTLSNGLDHIAEGIRRLVATAEVWDLETLASFLAVDEGLPSVTD